MRIAKVVLSLAILVITGMFYSNCAEKGLPDIASNYSSHSGPGSNPAPDLRAEISPMAIYTDQAAQILVDGGQPPYAFAVREGTASVSAGGQVTGAGAGTIVILIADSSQQTAEVALSVSVRPSGPGTGGTPPPPTSPGTPTPPPPPPPQACALPWGGSIASGQSVVAYAASIINCPSTAACQSQTRTCNNGVLSGTYTAKSCTKRACVYKETQYANGNVDGNNLCYNIPIVNQLAAISSSCTAQQYNFSKYCYLDRQGYGDESREIYHLYTCRGPAETITPTLYRTPDVR